MLQFNSRPACPDVPIGQFSNRNNFKPCGQSEQLFYLSFTFGSLRPVEKFYDVDVSLFPIFLNMVTRWSRTPIVKYLIACRSTDIFPVSSSSSSSLSSCLSNCSITTEYLVIEFQIYSTRGTKKEKIYNSSCCSTRERKSFPKNVSCSSLFVPIFFIHYFFSACSFFRNLRYSSVWIRGVLLLIVGLQGSERRVVH